MFNDLRYVLRLLRRSPGYSILAVVTLALGIGPNSALFSAFDQVILRLLPVQDPRQLVLINIDGPPAPGMSSADNRHTVYSYPQFLDYRQRSEVFQGVIARASMPVLFADGNMGERISGEMVSGNFFQVLGLKAARGRLLSPEDDQRQGAHPVAVVSHRFWANRLGGQDDALGRQVRLNGQPVTLVGVLGPEFRGLLSDASPDVYMTLAMRKQMMPNFYNVPGLPQRMVRHLNLLARLRPELTRRQAEQRMQAVFQGIVEDELEELGTFIGDAEEFRNRSIQLTPALQGINNLRDRLEEPLLSVAALVGLVLLISCVNLAGLMMARALSRGRELAVRTALGASRRAAVRQILLESLTLAMAGGLAGLAVAYGTMTLLDSWLGDDIRTQLDIRVLLFTFGLAALTCPLFGLYPALRASRADVVANLKEQSSSGGTSLRHTFFRKGAVVVQVALSLCLLVAAGLFARTLFNLKNVDTGFRTDNLLTFRVDPQLNGYDAANGQALYDRMMERLAQLPGVQSAAAANLPLLGNSSMGSSLSVEGYVASDGEELRTRRNIVSDGFFRTLGVPLILGREFGRQDRSQSAKAVIVNRAFVERYLPDVNPLGRRISFSHGNAVELDTQIIGVAEDLKSVSLREEPQIFTYTPYWQASSLVPLTFYLLSQSDEAQLGSAVRSAVQQIDPELPLLSMESMAAVRDRRVDLERSFAMLSGALAVLATLLSSVGLYGLVAYGVTRRRVEIGVRVAFGARRQDVLAIVVREALTYLALGLAIGVPATLALGRYLRSHLFGLEPYDPAAIGMACAFLAAAVLLAALLPARRAANVDPAEALRQ